MAQPNQPMSFTRVFGASLLLLGIMYFIFEVLVGEAWAHESRRHMEYDAFCCNGNRHTGDCQEIPSESVRIIPGGYEITLRPGDHRKVTKVQVFVKLTLRRASRVTACIMPAFSRRKTNSGACTCRRWAHRGGAQMTAKRLSEAQKEQIKREKEAGASYTELSAKYGIHPSTVRRVVDPNYLQYEHEKKARERAELREVNTCHEVTPIHIKRDAERRMAEIPPDTRDLTAYLMGDPIPNDWRRGHSGGSSHA